MYSCVERVIEMRMGEVKGLSTRHLAARQRNRRSRRTIWEALRVWRARRQWWPRQRAWACMQMSAGSEVRAATLSAKKMADEYRCLLTQSLTTPRSFSTVSSFIFPNLYLPFAQGRATTVREMCKKEFDDKTMVGLPL